MRKAKGKKLVLFGRAPRMAILGLFAFSLVLAAGLTSSSQSADATAAPSSYLNFQARLENATGSIAPDGNYDVTFHIFNSATAVGGTSTDTGCGTDTSCLWEETYSYNSGPGSSDVRLRVVNGYLTANLGTITSFGAINWSQKLWLTMDIGGTTGSGTITWDGQMSPRIQLTAVPYAFQAGALAQTDGSGNLGSLSFPSVTNNPAITLPNASGTVCINTNNCNYAPATGGSGYIQLQNTTPGTQQTGSFNISGTGILGGLTVQNASSQNLLTADTGTNHLKVYDGTATQSYVDIYYDDGTSSAVIAASSGTTKIGSGTGPISITAGASAAVTITGHSGSSFTTDAGNLTLDVTSASTPTLNLGTGSQAKSIVIGNATGATSVQLQAGTGGILVASLSAATSNSAAVCRDTSTNKLTACDSTNTTGAAFLQGGNSFGATANLGTNDSNNLAFRTGGATKLTLNTSGNLQFSQVSTINIASAATGTVLTIQGGAATSGASVGGNLVLQGGAGASTGASGSVLVKSNTNNSTTAFQIQDASGYGLLTADTTNSRLGVGINVPLNTFSVAPVDYQTGTVTRTNSSATLVGTGTTWTSAMNGDIIVFADGTTNYVGSFTDATHVTMSNTYTGTTDGSPIAYRFYRQGLDVASNGLVGIGITGPDAALSVRTAGQNAVVDIYGASGSPDYGVIQVSSAGSLTNSSNRPLSLQPNNGDVLIATTTDLGAKLSVGGTTLIKTTSSTALQLQDGSSNSLLVGDTSGLKIGVGATDSTSRLNVSLDVVDAANGSALRIGSNLTSTTNSTEGLRVMPVTNLGGNSTQGYAGIVTGVSSTDGTHLAGAGAKLVGLQAVPFYNATSGTLSGLFGQIIQPINNNTATVTTTEGVYIQTINSTTGTIGTNYGIYIDAPSNGGTISSNYALVTAAGAGNVGIGTLTPTFKLDVSGTTRVNVASATALQVQNGSGANLLTADTNSTAIVLGNDGATSALTVRGGAATGTNTTGSNITFSASNGTGSGGSGDFIFKTAAGQSPSPVAYDASASNVSSGTAASLSWSHTISGNSNRILMVNVMTYTASVSSVTYNGTGLTNLSTLACAAEIDGDTCTDSVWYLKESSLPAAGTYTVQVNLSASDYVAAGSTSFYNVNQTTPFGSTVTATQVADDISVYVPTSSAQQMVFDAESSQDYAALPDNNQTQSWAQLGTAGQQGAAGYRQGTGSTIAMSWTRSTTRVGSPDNDTWNTETRAVIAVPINPLAVSSSAADSFNDVLHLKGSNVGINTSNPQATLSVNGDAYFNNGSVDVLGVGAAPSNPTVYAGSNQGGSLLGDHNTTYYYQVSAITPNGETAPSTEVSISGGTFAANHFTAINNPSSGPTLALAAGTALGIGTYRYKVTFTTVNGETSGSPEVTKTTTSGNQAINLTAIPTGPTGTTGRNIYRTSVGGGSGSEQFVATIADNTTTTYSDTIPDASLQYSICNCGYGATTNTNNASLAWIPVSGATSYKIYRGTSSGGESVYFTSATNSYTDTGSAGTSGTPAADTTQRLGVGTANPRASLDVVGTAVIQSPINSTTALQVLDSSGTGVLSVDTVNKTLNILGTNKSATVDYSNEQYGGTFNSGWTSSAGWPTANWTISGTGGDTITHVAGNTTYLTYTGFTFAAGTSYQVTIDEGGTCGTSNDNVFFSIPGINLQSVTTVDGSDCNYSDHTYVGTATSGGNLQIFPSTNWTGSIDYISIIPIMVNLQPSLAIQNPSGTSNLTELRVRSNDLFFGGAGKFYINGEGVGENTAFGVSSQYSIVDGFSNTSVGAYTLQYNTYGIDNTAIGDWTLNANQGNDNTALGAFAMDSNRTGNDNTAIGVGSLGNSLSGDKNTALGENALGNSSGVSNNVALGYQAGLNINGSNNTLIGFNAGYQDSGGNFATTTTVQDSAAIGTYAQVQASNSIVLGSVDTATKIGIGTTVPSNTFSVSPLEYQTGTATRTNSSATLTGTGTTWLTGGLVTVGDIIIFADGTTNTVSSIASDTSIIMGTTYTGTTDASPVHYRFHHIGLQVTSGGYLGINTVSPATPLDVNGNASISGQLNASPTTSLPSYVNLVPNWSFEVNNDSVANFPDQWGPSSETTGTVSVLSTSSTNGKNSLELSSGASSSNIAATSSCFPISPSQTYSYATDAYASAAANGFVWRVFYFTNSSCTTAASTIYNDVTGNFNNAITASWQTFTGTQTSPSNAYFAWIRVYNYQTTNSNLVIDSMVMMPQFKTDLSVARTSSTALLIQDASGNSVLTVNTSGLAVTVAGTTSTFGNLTLTNAHFQSTQTTAPTIGTPTSCATTPSASITAGSTDSAGSFTITAGTGTQTSTCQVVITFNKAYGAAPKSVILSPGANVNSSTTTRTAAVTAIGTTTFTVVMSGAATVASTGYKWYYWVVQ